MSMKLSYRDKVIFIAVVVVAILLGGFFFFVKGKIQESQDAKNALTEKEQERNDVDAKIDTLADLKKQLEDSIKEVDEMQKDFLDEQETFQADQYLYALLEPTGVSFASMTLTGEAEGELSPYFYIRNSVAYDMKINADISGDSLPQEVYDKYYQQQPLPDSAIIVAVDEVTMELRVPCDADGFPDWEPILQVMDTVSTHDKTIYLKTFEGGEMAMEVDEESNAEPYATFNITVDVYSIEHMDTSKAR